MNIKPQVKFAILSSVSENIVFLLKF